MDCCQDGGFPRTHSPRSVTASPTCTTAPTSQAEPLGVHKELGKEGRAARGLPTLAWEGIVRTTASALDIASRTMWRQKSEVEACQAEAIVSA